MHELVLRHATVVQADAERACDLGVTGGRIAEMAPAGTLANGRRTIDAAGLHVLPGLVDAHVHLREPGLEHKEGFLAGTAAAAAGGVTTVMVMPTDKPVTLTPAQFNEKRALAEGKCHVDFALQAALGRDPRHVPELAELGAASFEIFLADVPDSFLVRDAETLLNGLRAVSAVAGIAGVTPGDHDIVVQRSEAIRSRSRGARQDFPGTRPPISEALGIARACIAARETRARIHIRQVSCAIGVETLRALRAGADVTAEVTPHNLTLDESELIRQGPVAKVAPPLRPRSDVAAMVAALRSRTIDIVATDHAPHLPAEKAAGEDDIWKAPGGLAGLQTFLPVMLGLVSEGALTLRDVVRTCASEPARIFGLTTKGRIAVGADADLVLVDTRRAMTIRNEDQLSKAARTPFAGRSVPGAIVQVFLRGTEIAREGRPVTEPCGRYLHANLAKQQPKE
jgi:dihydroorotase